ncbi:MAG TPA: arginine--tRNA ligase [Gemmataceae bacterium]|jgi:arginyl-tRNA synthetase|nr:arginine--tRNA ligase [Gemmataceae bacterium]
MNLIAQLQAVFKPVLTQLAPDPTKVADYLGMIRPAQNADHGDYQVNFAMAMGKAAGKKPQEMAAEIVKQIALGDMLEPPQVAGPGFINLRFKNDWLAARVREMAADERLGVAKAAQPKKYVIDYSSPNVAKPLHVGHLRSTIIGDAITRLLRFLGHAVITDNHLGDWGTQFGMLIYGYRHFLNEEAYHADPVRELSRLYIEVRKQIDKEVSDLEIARNMFAEEDLEVHNSPTSVQCQQETAKLHAGDADNLALWRQFMPHCLEAVHRIYRRLEILPYDHEHGESFYNPMLADVVNDMLAKGIAFDSQGAVVIPNAKGNIPTSDDDRKKEDPPALIRKRDGAFTYTTSDLATIKYRMEQFVPDAMLYVVDFRQALHFKTFFAQARRWGYTAVALEHISFGSVLGEDRKPFAARKGGAAELSTLLNEATRMGLELYEASHADRKASGYDVPDLTEDFKREIAEAVGIGAVKYADLSGNRNSDYVFSYPKMLATDGNTATYLQYAYARCRSIFRKEQIDDTRFRLSPPAVAITHPAERNLCLQLLRCEDALLSAASEYLPHYLATYLWDLAKGLSGFYENCQVLTAETPGLRDSRLLLVDLCGRVIRQALDLLGIRTVERM